MFDKFALFRKLIYGVGINILKHFEIPFAACLKKKLREQKVIESLFLF